MTDPLTVLHALSIAVIALPAAALGWLGLHMLVGGPPSERAIATVTGTALLLALLAGLCIGSGMLVQGIDLVEVPVGAWFEVGSYRFDVGLLVDKLSLPFVVLTCTLTGVVARFFRIQEDPS